MHIKRNIKDVAHVLTLVGKTRFLQTGRITRNIINLNNTKKKIVNLRVTHINYIFQ